jgi:hypothetical protein
MNLTTALKEWAVAIDALQQGKTIMLLRKGGIREQEGRFQVDRQQVLLYPTYEHQKPELLKSEYADQVTPVESGWHPETIQITAWAEITDILTVETTQGDSVLTALLPFHIWNDRMIRDRLKWKPRQPLYLLLLRTYNLPEPQVIRYSEKYGGCRSWIELENPISIEGSCPVLTETEYQNSVTTISQQLTM